MKYRYLEIQLKAKNPTFQKGFLLLTNLVSTF